MKLLITAMAAGAGAMALAPDDDTSGNEHFDALVRAASTAAAIEYRFEGTFVMEPPTGEKQTLTMTGESRMAWPNAGRFKMQYVMPAAEEGGEPQTQTDEFVGDGESVYFLDAAAETALDVGGEWIAMQPEATPMLAFLGREFLAPATLVEVTDEKRAGQRGLRAEFDQRAETLWLDADAKVVGITTRLEQNGVKFSSDFVVSGWTLHQEADVASYAVELPEGYQVEEMGGGPMDPNAGLLAVGEDAPDVTLTDMDGNEFQLASLKGKTVLLNFWFYH